MGLKLIILKTPAILFWNKYLKGETIALNLVNGDNSVSVSAVDSAGNPSASATTQVLNVTVVINLSSIAAGIDGFGVDHRNAKISTFGLPKLDWPMIKEFVKQMDGEIIPYHDHLDLYFFACEYI